MLAIVLFAGFMAVMIGIGVWGMRRTKSLGDYFLGGRSIGAWVSAIAYGTSYFSAVVFIGFAGKLGWLFGLSCVWIGVGNAVFGSLAAWLVLGKRTRRMTKSLEAMTMPEFFASRFDAPMLKPISAIIIFVFLLPYAASVFKGLGHLFMVVMRDMLIDIGYGDLAGRMTVDQSYMIAVVIMTVVCGLYLVLGGYFAITLTDMIQGVIMIVGSIAMVWFIVKAGGGFRQIIDTTTTQMATDAKVIPSHIPLIAWGDKAGWVMVPSWLLLVSLVFMTSFGTWGLPQMVQKFYAIRSEKLIVPGAIVTFIFALIIGCVAYFIGSVSHAFFDTVPAGGFDQIVPDLLHAHLPAALMAVILLLVLSASMSTLSSLILVASGAIAIDLYKGHVNPQVPDKTSLLMMRFLCAVFIGLAFLIALLAATMDWSVIVTLMSLSWGAVAGSFMAVFLYGLFWRGMTRPAAYAGVLGGLATMIGCTILFGVDNSPFSACLAMIVPFAIVPIVSLFTAPPDAALIDKAFAASPDAAGSV